METISLTKEQIEQLAKGESITIEQKRKTSVNHIETIKTEIRQEVEKWEPKGGQFTIKPNNNFDIVENHYDYGDDEKEAGLVRTTREQAGRAAKKMRTFNRLLAYVDEFDPNHKYDIDNSNCLVYYNNFHKEYDYTVDEVCVNVGAVYMSTEVATELCRKLNSREVAL